MTRVPEHFKELAYSTGGGVLTQEHRFAAIASETKRQYVLQFHPEVDDTPCGTQILKNFLFEICEIRPTWSVGNQVEEGRRRHTFKPEATSEVQPNPSRAVSEP